MPPPSRPVLPRAPEAPENPQVSPPALPHARGAAENPSPSPPIPIVKSHVASAMPYATSPSWAEPAARIFEESAADATAAVSLLAQPRVHDEIARERANQGRYAASALRIYGALSISDHVALGPMTSDQQQAAHAAQIACAAMQVAFGSNFRVHLTVDCPATPAGVAVTAVGNVAADGVCHEVAPLFSPSLLPGVLDSLPGKAETTLSVVP